MNCGEKCDNCCYVGEGDFVCLLTHKLVMEDFCPTENFGCCNYDWKAEKEKERVEQTNKRLDYAISQFEKYNFNYKVCNKINGHINVWRPSDNKIFAFYARTGKIQGIKNKRGIASFIKILKGDLK